jgi:predicted site-specific integrase-resolvase
MSTKSPDQSAIPVASPLADDVVMPFNEWCQVCGFSPATGRRLIARGDITVTRLSDRRIGVRGRHHREFLDRRAETASA